MSLSFRQIVMRGRVTLFIAMRKEILGALFTGAAVFYVGGVCLRRGCNALISYCNAIKSQVTGVDRDVQTVATQKRPNHSG
jgi:hypothetical protein